MILHQFPDLIWLKAKIAERFKRGCGFNGVPLETEGFPSVVIHTKIKESYRPDVNGPISLFMNLKGTSRCRVDGHTTIIPEDYFFISNRFQPYSLEIESQEPVETFNIHIGEYFSEQVLSAFITPSDTILNNGLQQQVQTIAFHNQLYKKDAAILQLVKAIQAAGHGKSFDQLLFEECMADLLNYLLYQHRDIIQTIAQMPAIKRSTQQELFRRLSRAKDYLQTHWNETIELDALAATACISKYHFLRLFKQVYGASPYQYLQQLRMEKAKGLLKSSVLSVQDISDLLGFENAASFSRLFYQRIGVYPTYYRAA